jgi:hypothetical protein
MPGSRPITSSHKDTPLWLVADYQQYRRRGSDKNSLEAGSFVQNGNRHSLISSGLNQRNFALPGIPQRFVPGNNLIK